MKWAKSLDQRPRYSQIQMGRVEAENKMARPRGFEPLTTRLEGGCSIQLSDGRVKGL